MIGATDRHGEYVIDRPVSLSANCPPPWPRPCGFRPTRSSPRSGERAAYGLQTYRPDLGAGVRDAVVRSDRPAHALAGFTGNSPAGAAIASGAIQCV